MTVQGKEEKLADAKHRVRDAFITFEHREGSRLVDVKELPTVMRSLGINASGAQLKPLLDSLQTEESSHISLDAFENAAAKFLIDYEATVIRDDYHMLVRAFKAFDPEGKGYLVTEQLKAYLMSQGECFSQDEAANMCSFAADDESNKLHYEDFAAKLANDGRFL